MNVDNSISINILLPYAVNLVRQAQRKIASRLKFHPEAALQRIPDPNKDANNQPLRIDYYAEDYYGNALEERFKGKVCAVGEETLQQRPDLKDITNQQSTFAIMDIIDGTDLLLRRFGNWCSAITFYYPPQQKIILSLVADHEGNVFYATNDEPGAYFYPFARRSIKESSLLTAQTRPSSREDAFIRFVRNQPSGPLKNASLQDASVCFVGQKPPQFLAAARNGTFCRELGVFEQMLVAGTRPAPAFRIYNLGGIPMMPRVANGILDAVVGLRRSKPHDFVAGAYIALKSGAFLGDLNGQAISEARLAQWLNHPDEKCDPYILACTEQLYDELLGCLNPDRANKNLRPHDPR